MAHERKADLLVIHPNPFWCRNIAAFCSTYGYKAEVVFSIEEGSSLLKEEDYPVVLLALSAPRAAGSVEKVQQLNPCSQLLVLSDSYGDISAAIAGGAYDYIHEPVTIELLIRRVHLAYCEFLLTQYGQGCRRYVFDQIKPLLTASCLSEEATPAGRPATSQKSLEIEVNRALGQVIRRLKKLSPTAPDAFTS